MGCIAAITEAPAATTREPQFIALDWSHRTGSGRPVERPDSGLTDRQIAPSPLAQLRDVNAAIRRLVIECDRRAA